MKCNGRENIAGDGAVSMEDIAFSGPYGAGKNTVTGSWEALHPKESFIHIELAQVT